MVELEFNHTVTTEARIIGIDDDSKSADSEVLVELENEDDVVIHVDKLQETRKHEVNHYDNNAFILKEENTKPVPFGKVTRIN